MNRSISILSLVLLLCNNPANGQSGRITPCDSVLREHRLEAILQGDSLYGRVKDGITKTDFELDFSINENTSFSMENGKLRIESENGETAVLDLPASVAQADRMGDGEAHPVDFPAEGVTVKDKDGNIYKVEQDPDDPEQLIATQVSKSGAALTADSFSPKLLDYQKAIVTFRKGSGFYAFDTWQDDYEKSYLIRDNTRTCTKYTVCRGSCCLPAKRTWWKLPST